jgi:hypothetical protein
MSIQRPTKHKDSKAKKKGGKFLYSAKLYEGLYINSPSAADTIFTSIPLFFAPVYFLCVIDVAHFSMIYTDGLFSHRHQHT